MAVCILFFASPISGHDVFLDCFSFEVLLQHGATSIGGFIPSPVKAWIMA
jgi:hypothetical protein